MKYLIYLNRADVLWS